MINKGEIEKQVAQVLNDLYEKDHELLEKDIHEQSVVHRFALYYEERYKNEYGGYNFDVEYNKSCDQIKRINGKNIRPDFSLHQRGTNENNLLVIEFKKNDENEDDLNKLFNLKRDPYNYRFAISIILKPEGYSLTWMDTDEY